MELQDPRPRDVATVPIPSLGEETALLAQGYKLIAGLDEAGRGCLAGPVVAAAVIMPSPVYSSLGCLGQVRDSKVLRPEVREELYGEILARAVGVGVGLASAEEIDSIGIVPATRRAMIAAVDNLRVRPEFLLIDYLTLSEVCCPQKGIVHGDALCFSIAAASIVAKVTRDRLMFDQDGAWPGYGFCRNKGYGTPEHLEALGRLGPSPIHRRTFAPVRVVLEGQALPSEGRGCPEQ